MTQQQIYNNLCKKIDQLVINDIKALLMRSLVGKMVENGIYNINIRSLDDITLLLTQEQILDDDEVVLVKFGGYKLVVCPVWEWE